MSIHPCASIFYVLCNSSENCNNSYSCLASVLIQILLKQKKESIFKHYNEYLKEKKIHMEGKTTKGSKK